MNTVNTIFETDRIIVRELCLDDFYDLHKLCSDAEVMKYVGDLKPYNEQQTRQSILKSLRSYHIHGFGGWALISKESQNFIGYGGFEFVPERAMPEVFYIFAADYWGKGFASEFAMKAVEYGSAELKMKQIGASFDPNNQASMKVASKAGLCYSHRGRDQFNLPTIYYTLTPAQK
jgi:ribosomal-protein-alanine N-acetyltransferase